MPEQGVPRLVLLDVSDERSVPGLELPRDGVVAEPWDPRRIVRTDDVDVAERLQPLGVLLVVELRGKAEWGANPSANDPPPQSGQLERAGLDERDGRREQRPEQVRNVDVAEGYDRA